MDRDEFRVEKMKIQKQNKITVNASKRNRESLIIQTICAIEIRANELK